ncbi:MAG TPA: glycosyltransferase [Candidatus Sulfomarinibacteraceae bacterium]|nr:glycosyltransferase [Candidatus Sulfomarinibacteraceae bacterium]
MTAVVIPSLGGANLEACLAGVSALEPRPAAVLVVLSGGAPPPPPAPRLEVLSFDRRLGFAAAVNAALDHLGDPVDPIALLNDDAGPEPGWLAALEAALDADPTLAAVQGTVTDAAGLRVDGRGIALDPFGLPIQVDRGVDVEPEPGTRRPVTAVSATAALYRTEALEQTRLRDGSLLDPGFGAYHEDLDLGLRLRRLGWEAAWVPGARASHLGSASGRRLRWRHPWWLLANRWRALAGNLSGPALAVALPRLLRGELRALRTLARDNPRAPLVALGTTAALPWLLARGLVRRSPGPRLGTLREVQP